MKHKTLPLTFTAALAIGLASCSKNGSTTFTAEDANKAASVAAAAADKAADSAKLEAAKVEAAKVEAAKVEAAKVEAAKVEVAKVEVAQGGAPKVEAASAEATKLEAARLEPAQGEAVTTVEASKADETDTAKTGLIEKAKSLIAEKKFSDASSVLEQLSGQSLNPQQAKLVEGLKEQIQKALLAKATENVSGSLGNFLKK